MRKTDMSAKLEISRRGFLEKVAWAATAAAIGSRAQGAESGAFVAPKLDRIRVAVVGTGGRGGAAVHRLCNVPGVEVVALCELDEAKAKNPESLEIAWTEARFVYAGGKGDVAAAERLLETARRMGKRKCGGKLADLSPHEVEVYCGILDYLSKIYAERGAKEAIRPLIDEARATGANTPIVGWMLERAQARP